MKRTQSFFHQIIHLFSLLAGVMLIIILSIQLFAQQPLQFAYPSRSLVSNLALYPVALAAIAGLFALRNRRLSVLENRWFIRALFLITLAVQFLVARTCWYHLGWDPGTVHATAEEIARGLPISDYDYFVSCPNNAPLTALLAVPLWAAVKIGLGVPYVVLPYIDAVILNVTAYVCFKCVEKITQNSASRLLALGLSLGWIALSPYIIFPYTDVYAIFFPVMALYLFLALRRPVLKWLCISLLCFIGAAIKPTVLIFLIALIMLGLCRLIAKRCYAQPGFAKRAVLIILAVVLGAVPGRFFQSASTDWLTNGRADENHLSMTHYLMLGMNSETYGGHSVADVEFTMGHETLAEGQAANLRKAWERVSERGLMGNLKFFAIKAYKAYADGSFATQGSFLELEVPERTDALSLFLRRFYQREGDLMPYGITIAQCLWLGILTLCAIAAFRQRKNPAVALISLTLLGLTAYLLLFEVWPRYLFLYAPFFVILAAMAFDKSAETMVK